ncbi:MAG: cupredoxin domain-containing protein [Chitinophagaceae bacterium]|nr:cupredoxin domain-containing protein [Chitinophagaceae bacterium]
MKIKNVVSLFIAAILVTLLIISCGKGSGTTNAPAGPAGGGGGVVSNNIDITNMTFTPANINVKVGTPVTWTNHDPFAHTATANDGTSFNLNLSANGSGTFTPLTAGTYQYHCNIHSSMTGTITAIN